MSPSHDPIATPDDLERRIYELTTRRLCGDLAAADFDQLDRLVCDNPSACTLFVTAMVETAALHYHTGSGQTGVGHRGSGHRFAETLRTADMLEAISGGEPSRTRLPGLGFLEDSLRGAFPGGLPFSPTLFLLAVLLASASWMAMAVWVIPWWRREAQTVDAQLLPEPASLARLTASLNCRWQMPARPRRGADLGNEMLEITSGTAELTLSGGTRVMVEGPARLKAESPGRLRLDQGRLMANVPEQAIGFTVETPSAAVIDLGTEFGVDVDRSGRTEVHTLRGRVAVHPLAAGAENSRGVTVSAGQAVRISAAGVQLSTIPFDGANFVRVSGSTSVVSPLESAVPADAEAEFAGTIWLGNLFDDPRHAPLRAAMRSDTFRAIAEVDDLGIDRVLYAGDAVKQICPGVRFDFANLGWEDLQFGQISNGTWSDLTGNQGGLELRGAIRTRGERTPDDPAVSEEGIGSHANSLITFDLAEIRAAGKLQARGLRFVCDRAGLNDSAFAAVAGSAHVLVLASDRQAVLAAVLDGQPAQLVQHAGIWSIRSAVGALLRGDGRFVAVRLAIPPQARYLTLAASSAGDGNGFDQAVWSGARLEVK